MPINIPREVATYSGYSDREDKLPDPELTSVGPGTPTGEYLRRFWHGIGLSSELGDSPLAIRILGENLVLFRDKSGRLGLVHKHCCHRRASLEYGRIEERGIRCCYHGWLYDIDGTLLEAPGEAANLRYLGKLRQPAYPVVEHKGLIVAYMGPPDAMPEFPIFDTCEVPGTVMVPYTCSFPCNWLQVTENGVDPVHSMFLHTLVNGPQFSETWGILGDVKYHENDFSVYCTISRRVGENLWFRVQENILPNITQSGAVHEMDGQKVRYFGRNTFFRWCTPVDDTSTKVVAWANFGDRADPPQYNNPHDIERLEQGEIFDRSPEESQRSPGDYEAMVGQGQVVVHAKEHMASSDRGVAMFRNRLRSDVRALQTGVEPRQPTEGSVNPIPTWSGDTILRVATPPHFDEQEFVESMLQKVTAIYAESDVLRGEERDRVIIEKLMALSDT